MCHPKNFQNAVFVKCPYTNKQIIVSYLVIFSSGGSGRTGTYIAISILLDRLKVEGVVDVFQTVRGLRLQRMHMVQTLVRASKLPLQDGGTLIVMLCCHLFGL